MQFYFFSRVENQKLTMFPRNRFIKLFQSQVGNSAHNILYFQCYSLFDRRMRNQSVSLYTCIHHQL